MKKKFLAMAMILVIVLGVAGCSSIERWSKDFKSDLGGGLKREVNVYSMDGTKIRTIKGKIDIENSDNSNKVKFDVDGKRYTVKGSKLIGAINKCLLSFGEE